MAADVIFGTATLAEVASAQSITSTVPAGVVNGDVLLLALSATTVPATVAGWTTAATPGGAAGSGIQVGVYYRVAASEPASYTVSGLNTAAVNRISATMVRATGVDTATPLDAVASAVAATGASVAAPVVTTTATGAVIHYSVGLNASSSSDLTAATGTTLIKDSTGTGRRLLTAYELKTAAGTSTARSFPITGTQINGAVVTFALRAASGPTGSPATASGSITLGGTVTARAPVVSAGSVTLGGTATARATASATGGIALAGTAAARVSATATGAVTLGGTATARAAVIAAGTISLAGLSTAAARAAAQGLIALGGLGATQVGEYVTHTYVTVALLGNGGTAQLAGDGTGTAALAVTAPGMAALAVNPPGLAELNGDGQSTAALAGNGTSSAALQNTSGAVTLQTTT